MVKYYYNKYMVNTSYVYTDNSPWNSDNNSSTVSFHGMYKSYGYNPSTNTYYGVGATYGNNDTVNKGSIGYTVSDKRVDRYTAQVGETTPALYSVYAIIHSKEALQNTQSPVYSAGSLVQSNIVAENGTYPANGRHTDGYWYVRGAVANTAPTWATIPAQTVRVGETVTVNLENYASDADGNKLTYGLNSNSNTTAITATVVKAAENNPYNLILTGKSIGTVTITVSAHDGTTSTTTTVAVKVVNSAPTINVTTPANNITLYENDVFNINGSALDANNGNTVTIRYQINALTTRAIKAFLSDGTTLESFSKTLTFKGGSLYDGDTLIASNLSDGIAHTLKVWATDDQGGTSAIREIPFYVVPNRAPLLTVNAPVISGNINSDKFMITGTFEDSDGNNTIISYRLNGASSVQVAEGVNGPFEFELAIGQLVIGANEIVVEAVDSYGAKVSKTVKLNKAAVETPLLKSTARYKINPPTGSAQAVLLWIQRDEQLDIDVSLNMTMVGEAESFIALTASNTAPVDQASSIVEDEFYHEAGSAKDNIIVQIDMTRSSVEVSDAIHLISGVLE